jgi:hypothetical protein
MSDTIRELIVIEEAEPFWTVSSLALKELMLICESMKSISETMRELMVMVDADPLRILSSSAVNELILTSASIKIASVITSVLTNAVLR